MSEAEDPAEAPSELASAPGVSTRSLWLVAIALGIGATLLFYVVRQRLADPTPELTEAAFDQAWQRWQAHEVKNYEIEIRVTGAQAATYRVVVEAGEATAAFRNGAPLGQRRTFETWSVPGMFSTIEADVARLFHPAKGSSPARLTLRAQFDPDLGYPQHYQRIEWGQSSEVTWDVVRFEKRD